MTSSLVEAQDPLELEESNIRLKPYLKQLNALKASLSTQLRELEDSRAFIALGISKEASEAMIKKAYHSKAIKLRTYASVLLIIDSDANTIILTDTSLILSSPMPSLMPPLILVRVLVLTIRSRQAWRGHSEVPTVTSELSGNIKKES